MSDEPVKRMRVFVVESPSAMDMLAERSETATLRPICKLLGHHFSSTVVRSRLEFVTAIKHITSINETEVSESQRGLPLCLHLAAHGDEDGLAMGAEKITWDELGEVLCRFSTRMTHYSGPLILVLSSCESRHQAVTKILENKANSETDFRPAVYVFVTAGNEKGNVYWRDSIVAWSIFYHQIASAVLNDRGTIKTIVDKVKLVGAGALKYFRWDDDKTAYIPYGSKLKTHKAKP